MINQFLQRCKAAVSMIPTSIVLGNEGGDMDSIVGSVYLAYLLTTIEGNELPVIPHLNFALEDLPLRNDVVKLFAKEEIDASLLQSVAVSQTAFALPVGCNSITLFDHNILAPHERQWESLVQRVVDHHADEKQYAAQSTMYEVATVGSASTIVVELFDRHHVPIPSPRLLLAPIVLDTMNFDPQHKKVTPRDVAAKDLLLRDIPDLQQGGAIDEWFATLNGWKSDTSSLTPPQCLRRDYKRFEFADATAQNWNIGISSVPMLQAGIESLYGVQGWRASLAEFRRDRQLDVLAVMYAADADNGAFTRELLFLVPSHIAGMFHHFADTTSCTIGLEQTSVDEVDGLTLLFYNQRDGAVSRKKLTPLLSESISQFPKTNQ